MIIFREGGQDVVVNESGVEITKIEVAGFEDGSGQVDGPSEVEIEEVQLETMGKALKIDWEERRNIED